MANAETELKFDLTRAAAARLAALWAASGAPLDVRETTSVYFDTPSLALRRAGLSLRVRHRGERRLQTVKIENGPAVGLFARPEWEWPIAGDRPRLYPPGASIDDKQAERASARLTPVIRVVVNRVTMTVTEGDALIEMTLDRGEIRAGGRVRPVCELELELKRGAPGALFVLARRLAVEIPLRLSVESKAERGYDLLGPGPPDLRGAAVAPPGRDATMAMAFAVMAQAALRQFRRAEDRLVRARLPDGLTLDRDPGVGPEPLHQARVGLRRLRSAFALFAPLVGDPASRRLRRETRWLANQLSDARALDVFGAALADEVRRSRLNEARALAYGRARLALASPRARRLMLDLTEWLALGAWTTAPADRAFHDAPLNEGLAPLLARRFGQVKREAARLGRLDARQRHKLRIQVKTLRYAIDTLGAVYDSGRASARRRALSAALEALQDRLGALNDLAATPAVLELYGLADAPFHTGRPGRRKLIRRARKAADAVVTARPFWR